MYNRLFSEILLSSVWVGQSPCRRLTWVVLLALADQTGIAYVGVPGLVQAVGYSRDEVLEAIAWLEAPDPDSRSPERDGRRIERVHGGWRIVTHDQYHAIGRAIDRQRHDNTAHLRRTTTRHPKTPKDTPKHHQTPKNTGSDQIRSDHTKERETANAVSSSFASVAEPPRQPTRGRPRTECPPPESCAEWCDRWRIPRPEVDGRVRAFLRWHLAEGRVRADWLQAWRNWAERDHDSPRGKAPGLIDHEATVAAELATTKRLEAERDRWKRETTGVDQTQHIASVLEALEALEAPAPGTSTLRAK